MPVSKLATKYKFENFGAVRWNSRGGTKITHIVVHHTAMTNFDAMPGCWGPNGREGSAHYGIGPNGEIRAYVDEDKRAWHAGNGNSYSIGIECTNITGDPTWKVSEKTIDALVALIQEIQSRRGKLTIVGHKDVPGNATVCPGPFLYPRLPEIRNRANGAAVTAPSPSAPSTKKVTVAKHATHYSKTSGGKVIAGWVKGQSFEVKQERPITQSYSNREYLLVNKGTEIGWVLSQDIVGGYGSDKVGKTTTTKPSASTSAWKSETGTFTANTTINVRDKDSTSGKVVATYYKGQSVNYDKYRIDTNGYVWISYVSFSGQRRYMATGESKNGKRTSKWGNFK